MSLVANIILSSDLSRFQWYKAVTFNKGIIQEASYIAPRANYGAFFHFESL